jgi:RNA recognition motif-containing protein
MDTDNPQTNPKKLFVGNLPYSTTQEELNQLFSQYGEIVEVRLITDRQTGRSKGIAFVEFSTEESANAAIAGLHNTELGGRSIIVNVARPMVPRENRGFGGNRGGGRRDFGNRGR